MAEQDGRREVVTRYGFTPRAAAALAEPRSGQQSGSPVADVIATGQPLFISSPAVLARHYPRLAGVTRSAQRAWAVVPVPVGKGLLVVCLMGFGAARGFEAEERTLLVPAAGCWPSRCSGPGCTSPSTRSPMTCSAGCCRAARWPRRADDRRPVPAGDVRPGDRRDFYDAIDLADGRVALVIGDVQGHNPIAASLMGGLDGGARVRRRRTGAG